MADQLTQTARQVRLDRKHSVVHELARRWNDRLVMRTVRVRVWLWLPDGSRVRVLSDDTRTWIGRVPRKPEARLHQPDCPCVDCALGGPR